MAELTMKLIPAQDGFIFSKLRHPAFVAAWGTGKSMSGIVRAMRLSQSNPNNVGVIFRKEYEDLRDSTVKDFERYTGLKVDSHKEAKLSNGSVIMFRHAEEMANIQNMNLGWFWIEQAEELDTDEIFFKLWGRLRLANVKTEDRSGFITANTNGHNWIYKLWKLKTLENGELFEAETADNVANLPADFISNLELLKTKKPTVYNRFVKNSWDEADTVDVIISPTWVEKASGRSITERPPFRRIVSIDVARFGDDKTVMYAIDNGTVKAKAVFDKKSTMETVGWAVQFAKKNGDIRAFSVDEIGVGAGVVDRLAELNVHGEDAEDSEKYQVIGVNSSEKSGNKDYYNRRAEIYAHGAQELEAGRVSLLADDEDLKEELCWARYKSVKSSGAFQVEAKDDIKKRYGRSPDHADAFLMGLWALRQVKPYVRMDAYARAAERNRSRSSGSPVAVLG